MKAQSCAVCLAARSRSWLWHFLRSYCHAERVGINDRPLNRGPAGFARAAWW